MKFELFNEIYGCYYSTIQHILMEASGKDLTDSDYRNLIKRVSDTYGFPETTYLVMDKAIEIGKNTDVEYDKDAWPIFDRLIVDEKNTSNKKNLKKIINRSRLNNIRNIPLSTLEKMWLKSIYSDPRIRLFCERSEFPEMEGVEELFDPYDVILFDQYSDGDPFEDEHYIEIFRKVLNGIHKKNKLRIRFYKNNNNIVLNEEGYSIPEEGQNDVTVCINPDYLEYSERDDKFRIIGKQDDSKRIIINVGSIISCEEVESEFSKDNYYKSDKLTNSFQKEIIIELVDDNNALERFLLNFSHYEKETDYLEIEKRYKIKVTYDETDETDLLIRILSFGSNVKVIYPDFFINLIRNRLKQQRRLFDKNS